MFDINLRYMNLFPGMGTMVNAGGRQYYFAPFWFELVPGDGKVRDRLKPHALGNLPQELRDVVQAIRDGDRVSRADFMMTADRLRLANPVDFGNPYRRENNPWIKELEERKEKMQKDIRERQAAEAKYEYNRLWVDYHMKHGAEFAPGEYERWVLSEQMDEPRPKLADGQQDLLEKGLIRGYENGKGEGEVKGEDKPRIEFDVWLNRVEMLGELNSWVEKHFGESPDMGPSAPDVKPQLEAARKVVEKVRELFSSQKK